MHATMIGLDISKSVFQLHGADASGKLLFVKRLKRCEVARFFARLGPSLVGIEACGSGHHWGRVIGALGHEVRLLPPAYVKPYVKRNKNDYRDAEGIVEALARPTMRFVPVKSVAQQAVTSLHASRDLLVRQRTQAGNALRGQAAEFGVAVAAGPRGIAELLERVRPGEGSQEEAKESPKEADAFPALALVGLRALAAMWRELDAAIAVLTARIVAHAREHEAARRLTAIPGVGPIAASLIVAKVADASLFRSGRNFAAWIGLTAKDRSSGATQRSGGVSKQGDKALRRLLVLGARSLVIRERKKPGAGGVWLAGLLARRPLAVAATARAAKTARIVWAMLARNETYQPHRARAAA